MDKVRVSVVGGSGYAGGELLRLLLSHPSVEIKQATSERLVGKFVHCAHPNLRKISQLKFSSVSDLEECDVLFLCLPHGKSMKDIDRFRKLAPKIIDLSGDFRLNNEELYEKWYKHKHENPDMMGKFVYGIPELHREEMKKASYISSAGCNATATILALYPLFKNNLVDLERTVVEVKVGSSEAGNSPNIGSHHPERTGCVRSFMPTGHRHIAEMIQELSFGKEIKVNFSATSIEMVRGILATCHVFLNKPMEDKDIWKIYRQEYGSEPFIRIVKSTEGVYR